jgi:hypothetical protein
MDYRTLPIGRSRRLAYAQINHNNNNIQQPIPIYTTSYTISRQLTLDLPLIEHDLSFFSYENLSNLVSIKNGLILNTLLENSTVLLSQDLDNFCVICQHTCINQSIVRKLLCKHTFHIECIDKWLTDNKTCPTCKFDLNK